MFPLGRLRNGTGFRRVTVGLDFTGGKKKTPRFPGASCNISQVYMPQKCGFFRVSGQARLTGFSELFRERPAPSFPCDGHLHLIDLLQPVFIDDAAAKIVDFVRPRLHRPHQHELDGIRCTRRCHVCRKYQTKITYKENDSHQFMNTWQFFLSITGKFPKKHAEAIVIQTIV